MTTVLEVVGRGVDKLVTRFTVAHGTRTPLDVLDPRDTVPRESSVSLAISRYEAHRLIGGQARRPSRNVSEPTELADMIEDDFGGVTVEFKSYGEVGK